MLSLNIDMDQGIERMKSPGSCIDESLGNRLLHGAAVHRNLSFESFFRTAAEEPEGKMLK